MKKYYSTLDKNKKQEIKTKFKKEYKNTDLNVRLIRLRIYAGIGYVLSIFIFIDSLLHEESKIGSMIIAITLFIASTFFLVGSFLVKLNVLNKIALKNK